MQGKVFVDIVGYIMVSEVKLIAVHSVDFGLSIDQVNVIEFHAYDKVNKLPIFR